jgi:hypothetical protein
MFNRHRKLCMESLEARQMMAGDALAPGNVYAHVADGHLFIGTYDTNLDQRIAIGRLDNGKIRVIGLDFTNPSLVNGQRYQDFNVTGDLNVNLYGGNDRVEIGGTYWDRQHLEAPSFDNVHISLGGASNRSDLDYLQIHKIETRGSMDIYTGSHDDSILIGNARIGNGFGAETLRIDTGAGADQMSVGSTLVKGMFYIVAGASTQIDRDVVSVHDTTVWYELTMATGGGDDSFFLEGVHVGGGNGIVIDTGAGDDEGSLEYVTAQSNLQIGMGSGSDHLELDHVDAYYLKLGGGDGEDALWKTSVTAKYSISQSGWEWINGRTYFSKY